MLFAVETLTAWKAEGRLLLLRVISGARAWWVRLFVVGVWRVPLIGFRCEAIALCMHGFANSRISRPVLCDQGTGVHAILEAKHAVEG